MAKSADLHIRISPTTLKRIQKLAKEEQRTLSACAARLLERALDADDEEARRAAKALR